MTSQDLSTSRFLLLPVELRLKVYRHLLISLCPLAVDINGIQRHHMDHETGIYPSIALCCKLTLAEAFPIIYSDNRFRVLWDHDWPHVLEDFVNSRYTTQTKLDLIKHVILPRPAAISTRRIHTLARFSCLEKLSIIARADDAALGPSDMLHWKKSALPITIQALPQHLRWFENLTPVRCLTYELSQMIFYRPNVAYEVVLTYKPWMPNVVLANDQLVRLPSQELELIIIVGFQVTLDQQKRGYRFRFDCDMADSDSSVIKTHIGTDIAL